MGDRRVVNELLALYHTPTRNSRAHTLLLVLCREGCPRSHPTTRVSVHHFCGLCQSTCLLACWHMLAVPLLRKGGTAQPHWHSSAFQFIIKWGVPMIPCCKFPYQLMCQRCSFCAIGLCRPIDKICSTLKPEVGEIFNRIQRFDGTFRAKGLCGYLHFFFFNQ